MTLSAPAGRTQKTRKDAKEGKTEANLGLGLSAAGSLIHAGASFHTRARDTRLPIRRPSAGTQSCLRQTILSAA